MTAALRPLYVIASDRAAILDALVDAGGELTPELAAQLDAADGDFSQKLAACAVMVKNLAAEAEKHGDEARRQADRAAALQHAAESLKGYMKLQMTVADVAKIEGVARIQANGGNQPVLFAGDPSALPTEYQRVKVELDAQKVLAAAKAGQTLPEGVTVGERGTHIRLY